MAEFSNPAAKALRLLTNPNSAAVIGYLERQKGEAHVQKIEFGAKLRQASTSNILTLLSAAGLVSMRTDGQRHYYRIVRKELAELRRFKLEIESKFCAND